MGYPARMLGILGAGLLVYEQLEWWKDKATKDAYDQNAQPMVNPGWEILECNPLLGTEPVGSVLRYFPVGTTLRCSTGHAVTSEEIWNDMVSVPARGPWPNPTGRNMGVRWYRFIEKQSNGFVKNIEQGGMKYSRADDPAQQYAQNPFTYPDPGLAPVVPKPLERPSATPGWSLPAPYPMIRPQPNPRARANPQKLQDIVVEVNPNAPPYVAVRPNPQTNRPRPNSPTRKRERKFRGRTKTERNIARGIFAAWELVDKVPDFVDILVDAMGGPGSGFKRQVKYLADPENWHKFDPVQFAKNVVEYLSEEIWYGRIEGGMNDSVNRRLRSPINLRDNWGGNMPDRSDPVSSFWKYAEQTYGW